MNRMIPTVDPSSKKFNPAKLPDCYQVSKTGYSASNRKLKLGMQLKLALNLGPPASISQALDLQPHVVTQFILETIQMSKQ